jgi:uncharacterized protein YutE (UPF0331/DUF86 family)
MDWLQFISAMTGHLAWPIAAVVIGFLFREQVRKLLEKMKSIKGPGGIEASFSEQAQVVAMEASKIEKGPTVVGQKPAKTIPPQPKLGGDPARRDIYRRKVESFAKNPRIAKNERPAALVLESWTALEDVIKDILVSIDAPEVGSAREAIAHLTEAGAFDQELGKVLHNLLSLRNQVANVEFEPDRNAALKYVQSAESLLNKLEAIHDELWEHRKIGASIESA